MSLARNMGKAAKRGERKTAREIGGRLQPGSGNQRHAKGDVQSADLLVERKDTNGSSYAVKRAELQKLSGQALMQDRTPVFVIGFVGLGDYAVITMHEYLTLKGLR